MGMSHWKKVMADLNKKLSVNSWFSDRFIISFSYFKSGYTFRNTSKSTSRKRKQSITLFLFSLTQLWSWRYNTGARPCRLLNLLTTHESISGHWDREATRKYLGRQISLFLGHKSQVPLRPFLSLGRGILLLSIPSWMTVTLFRVVLCFAPMMVTVPSLFPAYQNHKDSIYVLMSRYHLFLLGQKITNLRFIFLK